MNWKIGFASLGVLGVMGVTTAQTVTGRPVWRAESNQASAGFGSAVSAAGDVNGDGYGDIIVGAYSFSGDLNNEGEAAVFYGSVVGPSKTPNWSAEGDAAYANFGETVAGAGDVNGDGYDDVIVGAPQGGRANVYFGSSSGLATIPSWTANPGVYTFGWAVANAGDVNGDGFDDVLVSELNYSNDQAYEGRVQVYLGSPTGPSAAPSWSVEGNQAYSWFGGAVAGAGDVNGDGYDDVIVGTPRWHNGQSGEGRALLFPGSATGLATSPAWTVESDQAGAFFGSWVSSAGDVNGDGYDDVIVSANTLSSGENFEGGAFVYQGSSSGLSTAPAWTTESDQFGALGGAVSSGDLDGDGYGDVIVGYYAFNHGQVGEGAAFAFFGSPSGLATRPGWFAEGNQRDSMFGYSLSGAGDVNGDGFDDVVVGAYLFNAGQRDEGRAYAYLGSSRQRLR